MKLKIITLIISLLCVLGILSWGNYSMTEVFTWENIDPFHSFAQISFLLNYILDIPLELGNLICAGLFSLVWGVSYYLIKYILALFRR